MRKRAMEHTSGRGVAGIAAAASLAFALMFAYRADAETVASKVVDAFNALDKELATVAASPSMRSLKSARTKLRKVFD
ncbi:MAG: hypothetical protein GF344_09495, partial [Chitinivibrionales bacterium]|nr:hypothetical protein [Chitinivibrionales bacterium]MBD3357077.1 hypothetical protein [Chitinivibrionales bacterium]